MDPAPLTAPTLSQSDRRSVFVGNIPAGLTQSDLAASFVQFGNVKRCIVVSRPIPSHPKSLRWFGFVEFETEDEAQRALQARTTNIRENIARIEPKIRSARRAQAAAARGSLPSQQQPQSFAEPASSNALAPPVNDNTSTETSLVQTALQSPGRVSRFAGIFNAMHNTQQPALSGSADCESPATRTQSLDPESFEQFAHQMQWRGQLSATYTGATATDARLAAPAETTRAVNTNPFGGASAAAAAAAAAFTSPMGSIGVPSPSPPPTTPTTPTVPGGHNTNRRRGVDS